MSDNKNFIIKPQVNLAPFFSNDLINIHFEQHHMIYQKNLNRLYSGNKESLKDIINEYKEQIKDLKAKNMPYGIEQKILNNALQIDNHNLFWQSIGLEKLDHINIFLENLNFYKKFEDLSYNLFGNGWCWLTYKDNGKYEIETTINAEQPNGIIICVLDLWEHAYYLKFNSYKNKYVELFLKNIINHNFINQNIKDI